MKIGGLQLVCAWGFIFTSLVDYASGLAEVILRNSTVHGLSLPLLGQEHFVGVFFSIFYVNRQS